MQNRAAFFFTLLTPIFLGVTAVSQAATSAAFDVTAATTATPPKLDGTLDDPVWKKATHVNLDWDFTFRRPANETTDAYLLVDAQYVYVAFVASQKEPLTATQHTNDQPLPSDDVVRVYFWPAGDSGNEYGFVSNPAGTRYEFSSENTAFSPVWDSVAKSTATGYVVTERIPLSAMRGDGRTTWRLQFDRRIRSSNQVLEWAHNDAQGGTDSTIYAGTLHGMQIAARNARTKTRLAVYGLAQAGTPASGGSTSRMGLDLAVPVTQTSSFVATFHPDYSNVELDQQSISPTAFPRRFSEVRPFFTQGANYYNRFNCNDCLDFPLLYTPAIPTPREGYALEGTQGQITYGAFDAAGNQRNDASQSVNWTSTDRHYFGLYQRVAVDMPGVHDDAQYLQAIAGNAHNFSVYATQGGETGTYVSNSHEGRYTEYGLNLYTPKSGIFAAYHDIGSQYAPLDSFVQIADVHGPTVYMYREIDNSPHSFVQNVTIGEDYGNMADRSNVQNYAYSSTQLIVNTRTQFTLQYNTGYTFLRLPGTPGGYNNQNGVYFAYGANTSAPSSISYNIGRFAGGFLRSTDLQTSVHVTRRGTISLEAYKTDDALDSGPRLVQWLERASFGYQIGAGQSLAVGWRRIIGTPAPFFGTSSFIDGTNLTVAYYRRIKGAELYFAYGNPNLLNTQHDFIIKLIRYVGADKGT